MHTQIRQEGSWLTMGLNDAEAMPTTTDPEELEDDARQLPIVLLWILRSGPEYSHPRPLTLFENSLAVHPPTQPTKLLYDLLDLLAACRRVA